MDTAKKEAMLQALRSTLCVVAPACEQVGIARQTHYNWLAADPEYRQAVDDLKERTIDFAETQLHGLIKEQNVAAVLFYLKTKGKSRGYVETTDITSGGQPVQPPTWFGQPVNED